MAGGGTQSQSSSQGSPSNAAMSALAPNGQAQAATQQIPNWQKGLLGITTGDPTYGKNAPLMHQMMLQAQQQQRPQMPGQAPGMQGAAGPGMQGPSGPGMQGGMGGGMAGMNPQMLQQLAQQYPQLFGQGQQRPPGM